MSNEAGVAPDGGEAGASVRKRAAITVDVSSSSLQHLHQQHAMRSGGKNRDPASTGDGSFDGDMSTPRRAKLEVDPAEGTSTPRSAAAPLGGDSQASNTGKQEDGQVELCVSPICEFPIADAAFAQWKAQETPYSHDQQQFTQPPILISDSPSGSPLETEAPALPNYSRGADRSRMRGMQRNVSSRTNAAEAVQSQSTSVQLSASPTPSSSREMSRTSSAVSLSNVRQRGMESQVVSEDESESAEAMAFTFASGKASAQYCSRSGAFDQCSLPNQNIQSNTDLPTKSKNTDHAQGADGGVAADTKQGCTGQPSSAYSLAGPSSTGNSINGSTYRRPGAGAGSDCPQEVASASGSQAPSMRKISSGRSHSYKETLDAHSKDMRDGSRIINQYKILEVIGQGAYGTVHRAVMMNEENEEVAVKEFSKIRLRKTHRAANMSRRPMQAQRGQGRKSQGPAPGFRLEPLQQRQVSSHEVSRSSSSQTEVNQGGGDEGRRSDVAEPEGLEREQREESKDPLHFIRHELAILKKLHHLHVVKLYEVLDDPTGESLYIVFEYLPGGRVIDIRLHEQVEPLREDTAREYMRQIALGIEYLHHNEIVHRDIKPDNILLSKDRKVSKIVDFGVSQMFIEPGDDRVRKSVGSPAFMSPELCTAGHGDYHGKADDMWSFGVTFYCMVAGRLPFDESQFLDLYRAIREDEPEYPSHLSDGCKDVLKKLLCKDPKKRMTTDELREHPWVTCDGTLPMLGKEENLADVVEEITEEDVEKAIATMSGVFAVARAITKFKRSSASRRASSMASTASSEGRSTSDKWSEEKLNSAGGTPMRSNPSQATSLQDAAENVAQMLMPNEEPKSEAAQEHDAIGSEVLPLKGLLDNARFTMSPSASSEGGFLHNQEVEQGGASKRTGSIVSLVSEGGHGGESSNIAAENACSAAAVAISMLRPNALRKDSSNNIFWSGTSASADALFHSSVSPTATATSSTSAAASEAGFAGGNWQARGSDESPSSSGGGPIGAALFEVKPKVAAVEEAGRFERRHQQLLPFELAGGEHESDDETAAAAEVKVGGAAPHGDAAALGEVRMKRGRNGLDELPPARGQFQTIASALHGVHEQGKADKSQASVTDAAECALKAAAAEHSRRSECKRDEERAKELEQQARQQAKQWDDAGHAPQAEDVYSTTGGLSALGLVQPLSRSHPHSREKGDSVDGTITVGRGRPRILDGPLVQSPSVTKMKTPEGASEYYKGKPEGL
ncbi:hypothetical protein K437DRAFT_266261 [Tilletiaria anomala UBC 951]|uniref:Protein kinase domain-containing protein n=1 Tax=Tilletiaria anomala (strain ATCC 24038 / CBS 436.72 / UBC 951) TaxID=1037660 RepID=A0A066WP61_TILAU|nr:uncharacterized protein K437DRAFT_266261 [Tilletiaria anomala UBC 951]KDN52809.1 hypothetical protein K437DRAFT_266261 [Tilletiaria anomala UBC 951]